MDLHGIGKLFLYIGMTLACLGALFILLGRFAIFSNFGNLPGDIRIESENFSCFIPIASMILLSIILTVVANILFRIINRS